MAGKKNEVDVDVGLEVQQGQIAAAFNDIDKRIARIQQAIGKVNAESIAAAKAFNREIGQSIRDFNKAQGALDKFDATLRRPAVETDKSWRKNDAQIMTGRKAELKHQSDIDAAYEQRAKSQERQNKKLAKQENDMWAEHDRQRTSSAKKNEQLAERRWAVTQAREARLERERDKSIRKEAQLRGQNGFKTQREGMRAEVEQARTISDLERQRAAGSERLAKARGMLGKFGAEEDRQLHQIVALERERVRLANTRINAEKRASDKYWAGIDAGRRSDLGPDRALGNRALKAELDGMRDLGAVAGRRADTEARINQMIQRRSLLSGKERRDENNAIQAEIARLRIIDQRIARLQTEQRMQERRNAREQAAAGRETGGGGVFGAAGLTGVFMRTAGYGAAASAIYGTIAALRDGVTFTLQYEDALARLGAISGATSTQVEQLGESITKVAKNSRFSTLELAEASIVLAQAGFTQSEIESSLGSISQLATASGSTIAEATDVATAAIGAFQLQASETGRINDVLASALNRTKLNIQQVALGIQYAGATAFENKISFEELTAVMATMANAGIRSGSTIGTGIRQFLVDLQTPTEKMTAKMKELGLTMADIDVDRLGLPEVLNRLAAAGFDSASAYQTLETRAAAAYLVLRNNRGQIQEQIIAQNDVGQAAEAAAKGQKSLTAEWQRSKNVLNAFVEESIKPATGAFLELIKSYNDRAGDEYLAKLVEQEGFWAGWSAEIRDYLEVQEAVGDLEERWADRIEEVSTGINKATDAVGKQKTKLESLDDAIARVHVRHEELGKGGVALEAEMSSLMQRFDGLAKYLDVTSNSYDNLTNAMRRFRAEQLNQLGDDLGVLEGQQRLGSLQYLKKAGDSLTTMRDQGIYQQLPREVQQLIRQVQRNPGNQVLRSRLQTSTNELEGNARLSVQQFLTNVSKGVQLNRQANTTQSDLGTIQALRGPTGTRLQTEVSALAGKPDSVIRAKIAEMEASKKRVRDPAGRRAYDVLIEQAQNALGSGALPSTPAKTGSSASEKKPEIQFGSPVDGPVRVTSGVGPRRRPVGQNGARGSSNHQGVDIAGKVGDPVRASADGFVETVAEQKTGYGKYIILNHGAGTTTLYAHLSKILVGEGDEVLRGDIIGEIGQTGTATAPHLHYQRKTSKGIDKNPLSGNAAGDLSEVATGASRAQEQAAKEEERRAERNELALQRMRVANADRRLKDDLELAASNTSGASETLLREQVLGSFEAWEDALHEQLRAEHDRRDTTDAERLEQIKELNERIQQKRKEIEDVFFDSFMKGIEGSLEKLRQDWAIADANEQQKVGLAQARLTGLQAPKNRGRIPEYVVGFQQRRVEAAEQDYRNSRMAALPGQADALDAERIKMFIRSQTDTTLDPAELDRIKTSMRALGVEAAELRRQYALLNAEENAAKDVPQGFLGNAQMWIEDYRVRNGLDGPIGFQWGDLFAGMTTAMQTAQNSLGGFFSDVINKTKTVGEAFRDMKDAVLIAVGEMIAQLLAKKAFQLITSLATSLFGGPPVKRFHGGQVKAFTGRYITDGVPNRDSVDARIAKGEYVVRKSAVDSVGVDFMDRLNERGKHALKSMATKPLIVPQARQDMKVFVVAPEQRPQMGPNDVLVTIANDIANGGQTKQLIKHVSQGG